MNKELLEKIVNTCNELHNDLCTEMDETDTNNWHDEIKYYNADLNAIAVIVRFLRQETQGMLDDYSDAIED